MKTYLKTGVAAIALSLGVLAGAVSASAQTQSTSGTTAAGAASSDAMMKMDKASFAAAVASSNEFEIESSQMALKHSKSSDVKSFAKMMIKDHTKAGKEFMAAAKKADLKPKKKLNEKHAAMLQELKAADASNFDKMYVDAQTQAHQEAVTLFETYSASPDDTTLGAFAKKTLPTLQAHLEHVQGLSAK